MNIPEELQNKIITDAFIMKKNEKILHVNINTTLCFVRNSIHSLSIALYFPQ